MARKKTKVLDPATSAYLEGHSIIGAHPMFGPMLEHVTINHSSRNEYNLCSTYGWAVVDSEGCITVNSRRRARPDQWVYVIAHCLLHLGFEHLFVDKANKEAWNAACDYFVARFLATLKIGSPPSDMSHPLIDLPASSEEQLYQYFCERGLPQEVFSLGTGGKSMDVIYKPNASCFIRRWGFRTSKLRWSDLFGMGLSAAIEKAVRTAAGYEEIVGAKKATLTPAEQARRWFINTYPMLGALAASFNLVEDIAICHRMNISLAAVNVAAREIYINPSVMLSMEEWVFVLAHELLHVGLRHDERAFGRDTYLWNVACDYVINGWLVEMAVGIMPAIGVLYDDSLKGVSAEAIYDMLATDLRRARKLATFRGYGLGDIIGNASGSIINGVSLDEFCRRSLSQGLEYHLEQNRGFLPANLIEEIRSLAHPPIPWDAKLAWWFQDHFPPIERRRSYARPSRRSSSTPDIPRAQWYFPLELSKARTFGVVLDTSGSMSRSDLGLALGAIAGYSLANDVYAVRVVFCDAVAHDQGYMCPTTIAGTVKVCGRGGTILQPGIDLLENAKDFPKDGPILIITDGYCEPLKIRRSHAFLLPDGCNLPFAPKGNVFHMTA